LHGAISSRKSRCGRTATRKSGPVRLEGRRRDEGLLLQKRRTRSSPRSTASPSSRRFRRNTSMPASSVPNRADDRSPLNSTRP
jgi:hypothetical protein